VNVLLGIVKAVGLATGVAVGVNGNVEVSDTVGQWGGTPAAVGMAIAVEGASVLVAPGLWWLALAWPSPVRASRRTDGPVTPGRTPAGDQSDRVAQDGGEGLAFGMSSLRTPNRCTGPPARAWQSHRLRNSCRHHVMEV
jgi:hypothetical protein